MTTNIILRSDSEITYPPVQEYGSYVLYSGNIIHQLTLSTKAIDSFFGNLFDITGYHGACGNNSHCLWGGGSTAIRTIQQSSFATGGTSISFGQLLTNGGSGRNALDACADETTTLFGGGDSGGSSAFLSSMEAVQHNIFSDSWFYSDLTEARSYLAACSNGTYGMWAGGDVVGTYTDIIDRHVFTIGSNATDFGDLNEILYSNAGCSNNTYGVFSGGAGLSGWLYTIEYVEFASKSDSYDWGNMIEGRMWQGSASNGLEGLFIAGNTAPSGIGRSIEQMIFAIKAGSTYWGDLGVAQNAYRAGADHIPEVIIPPELPTNQYKMFNTKTSLLLENITFSSEGYDKMFITGDKTQLKIKNCIIEDSLNTSIEKGNNISLIDSIIETTRPITISNIDKLNFNNVAINVEFNEITNNFFSDFICKIESSDVFDFNSTVNASIQIDHNGNNYTSFGFKDSYVKDLDVNYNGTYNELGKVYWFGAEAFFVGGLNVSVKVNYIQYINIDILSNASYFADLYEPVTYTKAISNGVIGLNISGDRTIPLTDKFTFAINNTATLWSLLDSSSLGHWATSDGTYGVYGAGATIYGNIVTKIIININGYISNYIDVNLNLSFPSACSDGIYAYPAGGFTLSYYNIMEYFLFVNATTMNDWGDLTQGRNRFTSCSNNAKGIWFGGLTGGSNYVNTIDYITFATKSDATDWGDLTAGRMQLGSCTNGTRALIGGGYSSDVVFTPVDIIDYIMFETQSNATDFGDLIENLSRIEASSGS